MKLSLDGLQVLDAIDQFSSDAFLLKSHLASSCARVYRGLAIGVSVTLPRSTATLTRDPGRKFSRSSEGLGRATTTEPPTARSVALDMVWVPVNDITYKYNIVSILQGLSASPGRAGTKGPG